jgi:PilZ domain-containing protein
VQAEVRHCRASRDGSAHQVGVQFVGVDPQDERLLRAYLESRR